MKNRGGFYHTCPYCQSNLDAGEKCDCMTEKQVKKETKKPYKKGVYDERNKNSRNKSQLANGRG